MSPSEVRAHPQASISTLDAQAARRRAAQAYARGRRGEERAFQALLALPAEYTLFWGVHVPGACEGAARELDFVVLGPTGVWTIEVKTLIGTIHDGGRGGRFTRTGTAVHGERVHGVRDPFRQAAAQAFDLARHLGAVCASAVRPLVVFADDASTLRLDVAKPVPWVRLPGLVPHLLRAPVRPVAPSWSRALHALPCTTRAQGAHRLSG